jgi:S-adenosylmethionine-diacylgycerolhomoserine-N-methlytransferase
MDASEQHRRFLNTFYGANRHFYDWSRKYYLLGRDPVLRNLLDEPWSSLVEVGAGTGRNLALLRKSRPEAWYGALDASDEMLEHMRARQPWIQPAFGFGESSDLTAVLGVRPDRVLFSYTLSMVLDPETCIRNARTALAVGGKVVVVDFGDCGGLGPVAPVFRYGLHHAHVHPVPPEHLAAWGGRVQRGPLGYWLTAEFGSL